MTENEERKNEFVGKSIEEATAAAVLELGLPAEQLAIEVLEDPGALASLFGKRARIRVTPPQVPAANGAGFDPAAALCAIAAAIVPEATVRTAEDDQHLTLEIVGDGSGIFIGRKGATLEALQFIVERMAQKQGWTGKRLVVESERYRQRHADAICEKARQLAERVRDEGRPQFTEMLCASDRRLVHSTVKEVRGVTTHSQGEGEMKRVQIMAEGQAERRDNRGRGRAPSAPRSTEQ
jgi:spoIIIJ-associated protein